MWLRDVCLGNLTSTNEAAVYYERQPKADVFLQEIHDRADLYKACSLITDLHEQHPSKQLSLNLTLFLTEEVSEL